MHKAPGSLQTIAGVARVFPFYAVLWLSVYMYARKVRGRLRVSRATTTVNR